MAPTSRDMHWRKHLALANSDMHWRKHLAPTSRDMHWRKHLALANSDMHWRKHLALANSDMHWKSTWRWPTVICTGKALGADQQGYALEKHLALANSDMHWKSTWRWPTVICTGESTWRWPTVISTGKALGAGLFTSRYSFQQQTPHISVGCRVTDTAHLTWQQCSQDWQHERVQKHFHRTDVTASPSSSLCRKQGMSREGHPKF